MLQTEYHHNKSYLYSWTEEAICVYSPEALS